MLRVVYVGLPLLLSSVVSFAQTVCPTTPPPYSLLREDDDNRYLENRTCRRDLWDKLEYVPLGSNRLRYLSIGGEAREWYEGMRNPNWGRGAQDGNGYLLQRLNVHADVHATRRVRFFVQLTSDFVFGRNGGPRPIDESRLFFENGFADITLSKRREQSTFVRLGRQEFRFGSGRMVDVREGPNVRQAFDGVSLKWTSPSWTVTGFTVSIAGLDVAVVGAQGPPVTTTRY